MNLLVLWQLAVGVATLMLYRVKSFRPEIIKEEAWGESDGHLYDKFPYQDKQ